LPDEIPRVAVKVVRNLPVPRRSGRNQTADGQSLLEYALLGAFVAMVVLMGATGLGASIGEWLNAMAGVADEAAKKSNCSGRGMAASDGRCHGG
jgi:Flp pilus assembly pilin Flp